MDDPAESEPIGCCQSIKSREKVKEEVRFLSLFERMDKQEVSY